MMNDILFWAIISAFFFLLSAALILWGIVKKRVRLVIASVVVFLFFIGSCLFMGFKIAKKSYRSFSELFKARTGEEIYEALFNKPANNCVTVLEKQDQVIPRIDPGIFLHFKTCPQEMNRVLAQKQYVFGRTTYAVDYADGTPWFKPQTLADTVLVFSFTENQNRQTFYVNKDSTEAFLEDIAD